MLIEVDSKTYKQYFPVDPHPFVSDSFIELNKGKTERIIRLIYDKDKPSIGLVAGINNGIIQSPFSAPFGGFHFRKAIMYISEIDEYIDSLKSYISKKGLKGIEITLPPDIYSSSLNAKTVNSFIRNKFTLRIPDITNYIDLMSFDYGFKHPQSRNYLSQARKNGLVFSVASTIEDKKQVYNLIYQNRINFGRSIFMSFQELLDVNNLWPVDFLQILNKNNKLAAGAVYYRSHPLICYGVFRADNEVGRPLRAVDFLAYNALSFYKDLGFKYLDEGISSAEGIPNEGLLRYKETHEAVSSLRHKFIFETSDLQ